MKLHKFSNARELVSISENLNIKLKVITGEEANKYIYFILNKYQPRKTEGHLSVGNALHKISTDKNEFSFSRLLKDEHAFLFFEQNSINKDNVIIVEAQKISLLMENSHGMEYFISNESGSYLISVNWYVIESIGDVSLPEE